MAKGTPKLTRDTLSLRTQIPKPGGTPESWRAIAEPPRKPFMNMNVFISMHVYCVL